MYILLLYANAFEGLFPGINYWDEIVTIVFVLYFILRKHGKIRINNWNQWLGVLLLVLLGFMGNIVTPNIQNSKIIIVKDIFAITKFFVICLIAENFSITKSKKAKIISYLAMISRVLIVITSVIAVIGYFIDIGVYTGEIRIVNCFKFIFSVPTFFVSSYVLMAAVLICESIRKNRIILLIDCLLLFMAQRTKGYVAILVILMLVIFGENKICSFFNKALKNSKLTKTKLEMYCIGVIGCVLAYFLGKNKIQEYMMYGIYAARPALYMVGLRMICDFFPLGSGFGTFASSLSTESYSKIYSMYSIQNVLGLVEGNAIFAADVFWPCIYGQLGILGFFVYLKIIIGIIKNNIYCKISAQCKIAILFMWSYALVASTSEAYFTNSSGVQFAFILMMILGIKEKEENGYI